MSLRADISSETVAATHSAISLSLDIRPRLAATVLGALVLLRGDVWLALILEWWG